MSRRRRRLNTDAIASPYVPSIESLEEITHWLGTFRERLRLARAEDREHVAAMVKQLEARYLTRRAELS